MSLAPSLMRWKAVWLSAATLILGVMCVASAQVANEIVLRAPIGQGVNALGIATPAEANPEGPMSFALAANGDLVILDQVNARLQIFRDKRSLLRIPLNFAEKVLFSDLALLPDQRFVLLGQSFPAGEQQSALYLIDSHGQLHRKIDCPAATQGIRVIAAGRFAGLWCEQGNEMTLLATLAGEPVPPRTLPGILSAKGDWLMRIESRGASGVTLRLTSLESDSSRETLWSLVFAGEILHTSTIGSDAEGRIYLDVLLETSTSGLAKKPLHHFVVVIDAEQGEIGRVPLFVQTAAHEVSRPLRVMPDGRIYQLAVAGREVIVRKYTWQSTGQIRPLATDMFGSRESR